MGDTIWSNENKLGSSKQPKITFSKKKSKIYRRHSLVDPAKDILKDLFLNTQLPKYDSSQEEIEEEEENAKASKRNQIKPINLTLTKSQARQARQPRQQEQKQNNEESMASSLPYRFMLLKNERHNYGSMDQLHQEEDYPYDNGVKHKVISHIDGDDDDDDGDNLLVQKRKDKINDKRRATNKLMMNNTTTNLKGMVAKLTTKDDEIVMSTTMKRMTGVINTGHPRKGELSGKNASFLTFIEPKKSKEIKGKMPELEPLKPLYCSDGLLNLSRRKMESKNNPQQDQTISTTASSPYFIIKEMPQNNMTTQNNGDSHFKNINCIAVSINRNKDNTDLHTQTQTMVDENGNLYTTKHEFSMSWPFSGDI